MRLISLFILSTLLSITYAFIANKMRPLISIRTATTISMGVTLYGSQQTRSPLVNWYLLEKNIPFTQKPARPNPNPFGQIPYLTDDNNIEVFESGAILLYLADAYGGENTPQKRAQYTKWVVWANSELDGLCFGKTYTACSILYSIVHTLCYWICIMYIALPACIHMLMLCMYSLVVCTYYI